MGGLPPPWDLAAVGKRVTGRRTNAVGFVLIAAFVRSCYINARRSAPLFVSMSLSFSHPLSPRRAARRHREKSCDCTENRNLYHAIPASYSSSHIH